MRVIHIIPAAFDYFDNIKRQAFELVEEMNEYEGVEAEAFTLQYGAATVLERVGIRRSAPHQKYVGLKSADEASDYLNTFDVVHLHAPFMGAGKMILKWRKNNLDKIFIVSDYGPLAIVDLISVGIRWYNSFYLKRLKLLADIVLEDKNVNNLSAEKVLAIYNSVV